MLLFTEVSEKEPFVSLKEICRYVFLQLVNRYRCRTLRTVKIFVSDLRFSYFAEIIIKMLFMKRDENKESKIDR